MSTHKQYEPDTRVYIKSTGKLGKAYESAQGFISVLVDGEEIVSVKHKCRNYSLSDVIFL